MNTNTNVIRILCYGDSNTWGYIPAQEGARYPANIRWTGLLQKSLGERYEIIEEGLSGRTTVIEDSQRPGINGKTYLRTYLESHRPLDLIVIMLGTNDLKEQYNRKPGQITQGMEELITMIKDMARNRHNQPPVIILMSPPLVDETVAGVEADYKGAEEKSRQLGPLYKELAQKHQLESIDVAQIVPPSSLDGYHLDFESHRKIAAALTAKIRVIPLST